jgi:histidyl-tRNA synthetase
MSKFYASIRGTYDFSPSESCFLNKTVQKARDIFALFGYEEIILPLLEEEGLFIKGVGETTDIIERQMFKIEGKDIVLRPEGTAQMIRYYLEHALYKRSDFYKFSYIGPMFRGERPQKGRLRQFHHIGAEAIGSDSYYLDAELINLSMRLLDEIGVTDKELKINTLGCIDDRFKFSKELKKKLDSKKFAFCQDCQRRLGKNPLRVLDCKKKECKKALASLKIEDAHLCGECKQHFNNTRSLLDDLNISYTYDPHLVRGLDYYTNTVFEIVSKNLGSQDAIGAGGRYNNLVKRLGGPDIPAIGFALGIERLLLILKQPEQRLGVRVFIVPIEESLKTEGFKLLQKLREAAVSADITYREKSLKGQLRYAQKKGAEFVVIVGEDELKERSVMLRDMRTSQQEKVKISDIVSKIKGALL